VGLIATADPSRVIGQRRENYLQLENAIRQFPRLVPLFTKLQDGVCPLVFPIIVKNRSAWLDALLKLGVGAYAWWDGFHRDCSWGEFAEARHLKECLLCLPINQGLGKPQINFLGEAIAAIESRMR
jgi:perosamine synthetase